MCVEGDLLRFICPDLRGGWFWGAVVLVRLWWGLWLWLLLEGREREERQGFLEDWTTLEMRVAMVSSM